MKPRVYVDTSVIGGCYDEEFSKESRLLLDLVQQGEFVLLISDLLLEELSKAPVVVQSELEKMSGDHVERVFQSEESRKLRDAYLKAKVVGPKSRADAHHVALATVAEADVIVSWNFKHIVHLDKIKGFNSVNRKLGYSLLEIRTPREIV